MNKMACFPRSIQVCLVRDQDGARVQISDLPDVFSVAPTHDRRDRELPLATGLEDQGVPSSDPGRA